MTSVDNLQRKWQRLARHDFYVVAVAALVQSLRAIDIVPEFLYDAPAEISDLTSRM